MQIFRDLAGYSLGAADMVRRAVAKKQADVLAAQRKFFLYGSDGNDGGSKCDGCLKRGISEDAANKIFDDMASFASYAFNKSHSAAYALVTYRTAWLRKYYPQEFMAAMLTSVLDNTDKVVGYITECQTGLGFQVLPPSVNESEEKFTVVGDNVRFGLLAIKNLGSGIIQIIIKEREENGPYGSFNEFCRRCYGKDLNKRALESLIKSGACDCFGLNRNQMLLMIDEVLLSLENDKKSKIEGQIGLFDLGSALAKAVEIPAPDVPEMPQKEKLQNEKLTTGLYMSGHPMAEYTRLSQALGSAKTAEITSSSLDDPATPYHDGDRIRLLCILATVRKKITKNNTTMAFLSIEDIYGSIEVLVFPKTFDKYGKYFTEDEIVLLSARVSLRDDEVPKLLCEEVVPLDEIPNDEALLKDYKLPGKEYKTPRSAYSAYVPESGYDNQSKAESQVVTSAESTSAASEKQNVSVKTQTKHSKAGVFLKVSSRNGDDKVKASKMCAIFEGRIPVYLYYNDERAYDFKTGIFIENDANLIRGLKKLLGEQNVVVRL